MACVFSFSFGQNVRQGWKTPFFYDNFFFFLLLARFLQERSV